MSATFDQLVQVMARLRAPGGCPWDRQQTAESLKPFLLEETYEVLEAIDSGKAEALYEELGDLLFQILFHAEIAQEKGVFDMETVMQHSIQKMTRRHPHVFKSSETPGVKNADEVIHQWEAMKMKEKREKDNAASVLSGVPKTLPALLSAYRVQEKVSRVGFDWKTPQDVFEKIEEELQEVKEALAEGNPKKIEAEWGDFLFSLVNFARWLKINSEDALRQTVARFMRRFQNMEKAAGAQGLEALSAEEKERLWEDAKRHDAERHKE